MAWNRATLPITEGGIGAPSVELRYEAIEVGCNGSRGGGDLNPTGLSGRGWPMTCWTGAL